MAPSDTDRSPKTRERYIELAERQVIPHLGDEKLQALKPEHLEHWHAAPAATGLSARTVGHAHRVLGACLRRAVENGTLARNVTTVRKPPKVEDGEVEILNQDQVSAVLTALKGHALYPIVVLALSTGCRRGELCGLEWRDIDLDRGTLRVERSIEETRSGGLRVKSPKTRRGRRNISLPLHAVELLREHYKAQLELRLQLGLGGKPTIVFATVEGRHIKPNSISRDWLRLCTRKKLPRVSFHALRHTHVSALIRQGVDILTISRRIGHSKPATTLNVYGRLVEGSDAAAAKAIEGMLK